METFSRYISLLSQVASINPNLTFTGHLLPPLTPSSTVPFQRDPNFVDRQILAEIDGKSQQPVSRVALIGLGGVGYTEPTILLKT